MIFISGLILIVREAHVVVACLASLPSLLVGYVS